MTEFLPCNPVRSPAPDKPQVRCYYLGDSRVVVNIGDLLVPYLLEALGYACAPRSADDSQVINPGRCLLVVGSLLTRSDMEKIAYPLDVWGCGWKGAERSPSGREDARYFAVRGPQTAAGLSLPSRVALGDPVLLLPRLMPLDIISHGSTVVIPHLSRLTAMRAAQRLTLTGCDEILSPMVLRPFRPRTQGGSSLKTWTRLFFLRARFGIQTCDLWQAVGRIAGADFVLSGSLHGAILAQAFGVPWAAYDDGYVDAPPKWTDWAAYLNVDLELVRTLKDGRSWWARLGRHGRIRSLAPLLRAFPYEIRSPSAWRIAQDSWHGKLGGIPDGTGD
jgi:hypothetical protein